jgi:hypothetical protein
MPGDTLSKEELLLVEQMIGKRVYDIDGAMEAAYSMAPREKPEKERRLWARNRVLAEILQTQEFASSESLPGIRVARKRRQPPPVKPVSQEPKESPFDVKPRVFTLDEEQ